MGIPSPSTYNQWRGLVVHELWKLHDALKDSLTPDEANNLALTVTRHIDIPESDTTVNMLDLAEKRVMLPFATSLNIDLLAHDYTDFKLVIKPDKSPSEHSKTAVLLRLNNSIEARYRYQHQWQLLPFAGGTGSVYGTGLSNYNTSWLLGYIGSYTTNGGVNEFEVSLHNPKNRNEDGLTRQPSFTSRYIIQLSSDGNMYDGTGAGDFNIIGSDLSGAEITSIQLMLGAGYSAPISVSLWGNNA